MGWLENPAHIVVILCVCVIIIIIQGTIIHKLIKRSKEEYEDSTTGDLITKFRNFWGEFIVYVLATSIILLFIASLVFKQNITLQDMNSWVSIVLGLVALIVGIISLWLSFYNVEQSSQMQKSVSDKVKDLGALGIGWRENKGNWYYLRDGEKVKNEWKKSGNSWYYLGENGYIEKNKCIIDGEDKFYVDSEGRMVTNAVIKIDNNEMYFGEDGKAIVDGEKEIKGKKYIFKDGHIINKA